MVLNKIKCIKFNLMVLMLYYWNVIYIIYILIIVNDVILKGMLYVIDLILLKNCNG